MKRRLPIAAGRSGRPSRDWFEDGVRFRCLGPECGACCSGAQGPGRVWLRRRDLERLAAHLSLSLDEVGRRYVRRIGNRYSLTERLDHDCVFYRPGRGCTVYEARPAQCRTYPFWGRILASRVTWEIEAEACPGIGPPGSRIEASEVRRLLAADARRTEG